MDQRECNHAETDVINSRPTPDGIRRRRECRACGWRWSTIEVPESEYQSLVARANTENALAEDLLDLMRKYGLVEAAAPE